MIYAGIGSRKTPELVCSIMSTIAQTLAVDGHLLRSGAAEGADWAFEVGSNAGYMIRFQNNDTVNHQLKEIYLPWKGFNNHSSRCYEPSKQAYDLAETIHPNWTVCTKSARAMHARNVHQILGEDCQSEVDFVLCWTPKGAAIGGTRTAIILAQELQIPVFNMATPNWWNNFLNLIQYSKNIENLSLILHNIDPKLEDDHLNQYYEE